MVEVNSPDDGRSVLAGFRAEIDAIDMEIVALLARRMAVVDRVIAVKTQNSLPALIPARVEEVAAHVRKRAQEAGIAPDLAETVWRSMMDWVIDYEDKRLGRGSQQDGPQQDTKRDGVG